MDTGKKPRLEKKGWKVGTVAEFLDLAVEESAYIEMKLALSEKTQGAKTTEEAHASSTRDRN